MREAVYFINESVEKMREVKKIGERFRCKTYKSIFAVGSHDF